MHRMVAAPRNRRCRDLPSRSNRSLTRELPRSGSEFIRHHISLRSSQNVSGWSADWILIFFFCLDRDKFSPILYPILFCSQPVNLIRVSSLTFVYWPSNEEDDDVPFSRHSIIEKWLHILLENWGFDVGMEGVYSMGLLYCGSFMGGLDWKEWLNVTWKSG